MKYYNKGVGGWLLLPENAVMAPSPDKQGVRLTAPNPGSARKSLTIFVFNPENRN